ncbi:MAG TPA: peptidoglycan-associated lipoprotein Pal [Candidatus Binatia bacterium]|nr:peptidoglycan-associated lipoprotein Pal [Candidatus Binatia bacterium]
MFSLGVWVVLILSGLALAGCSSETAKKPDSAAAVSAASRAGQTGKSPVSRQSSSGSSLEAHRQGKAPQEGPLKEIYFDFDKYDLTPAARATLQANAAWLKANPAATVEIEGHCDERGTTEYNLALGAKRARAAMQYLISLGIGPARIKTISYGEELPVCKEATEECYQKNRRDRFVETRVRPAS